MTIEEIIVKSYNGDKVGIYDLPREIISELYTDEPRCSSIHEGNLCKRVKHHTDVHIHYRNGLVVQMWIDKTDLLYYYYIELIDKYTSPVSKAIGKSKLARIINKL